MEFTGFQNQDFDVFEVPGLDLRMEALKAHLRPKLEQLGKDFSDYLGGLLNHPIYAHVAKHARRTVNPPKDSWVAFGPDKRGYKKYPHFQIGAWQTHAFATFGMIYEAPDRGSFAERIQAHAESLLAGLPKDYVLIPNHMDPNAIPVAEVTPERLKELATRLGTGRQGELLVGIRVPREEAVQLSPEVFENRVKTCFETILPWVRLSNLEAHVK